MSDQIAWRQSGRLIPRASTPYSPAPGYYIDSAGGCVPITPQVEPNAAK